MASPFTPDQINRRHFISTSALAGTGLLLGPTALAALSPAPIAPATSHKKRYALVGLGGRSGMFREAVMKTYAAHCEMVAFCDNNIGRLQLAQKKDKAKTSLEVPIYEAQNFDLMVRETKPDVVIVTTKDSAHHHYIIRAMELGCDVITEKPMTIDAEKCQAVLDTQKATGRTCTVSFNYRYSPHRTQVKELLMSGIIGDILSVDFHWLLDTVHGADYFRRWHSRKSDSGGLLVHKSTHHFDLINWWLSAVPVSVLANGKREFYTPEMARRLGLSGPHERCHACEEKDSCSFFLNLAGNKNFAELYLAHEHHDGYFRDACVWRPDIDIEDTMNVIVSYDTGATLSYSLNAFNGWEGYRIAFNGTKGRLEHGVQERVYVFGDGSTPGAVADEGTYIRVFPMRAPARQIELWPVGGGGHGGGDNVMLDDLFLPKKAADKYLRAADHRAGAYSILTGIAANHSIKTGQPIVIKDLVAGLTMPDYTPMPSRSDPVPMPP